MTGVSLERLYFLVRKTIIRIWAEYCWHVIKVHEEYWIKDGIIEDAVDSLVISLVADENSNDENSDEEINEPGDDDKVDRDIEEKDLDVPLLLE